MTRALIAMSGGVDSGATAFLMQKMGYDCVGVTLLLHEPEARALSHAAPISGKQDAADAARLCAALGIPHRTIDRTAAFETNVMQYFVDAYRRGETPNPCVECNRTIKFAQLLRVADQLGCEVIATGHYARIEPDPRTGRTLLCRAADAHKDQSYVLYALSQTTLARTILPLGTRTKKEVRSMMAAQSLPLADKKESQDICFVPNGDYASFVEAFRGESVPPGPFVTRQGKFLGMHRGIFHYTIGQRRGLGIAAGLPLYVTEIRAATNEVVLGPAEELFRRTLKAVRCNWIAVAEPPDEMRILAKIRYRQAAQPATLYRTEQGVLVRFDTPQRAVTPGQSVVFYDGDRVVGGGTIAR